MTYLISYDLNKPGQSYSQLYESIKAASNGIWCKPLESVYIIRSSLSAQSIYNKLTPHLDPNDRILVVEIKGQSYWCLDKQVSDYLQEML